MSKHDQTTRPEGAPGSVEEKATLPETVCLLPTDMVLFPGMVAPALISPRWAPAIDEAAREDQVIGVFARREGASQEEIDPSQLYPVGTLAAIVRLLRLPDGSMQVIFQGGRRVRLLEVVTNQPTLRARVEPLQDEKTPGPELEALQRTVMDLFRQLAEQSQQLPAEVLSAAADLEDEGQLADFVAVHARLSAEQLAELLASTDVNHRLRSLVGHLQRELEIAAIGDKIRSDAQGEMDKVQREYYLREQLKAIQRELGEVSGSGAEIEELGEQLAQADLPEEARKEAERELERLSRMTPASPEYTMARTYLDWMLHLPWGRRTEDQLDIERAERILEEDHYDLEKVKQRILDYLAVLQLKPDSRSPILCFVGPPGVGKTSLGQSIARALGREFARISLGGVRDEAELRGHRRTYIGALPGRIIQGLRRAGSSNPVFMLDEVDKIGADYRGDPAAALLEVLDPEQNNAFTDHYLGVAYDLSRILFIATANTLHTIPSALLDRMEVIEIPGYTEVEKLEIARRYLVPRQVHENGLQQVEVTFQDEALQEIIRHYTREAGVRNLEREIGSVCRRVARKVATGDGGPVDIGPREVADYVGPPRFRQEAAEEEDEVGVATGLFWTPTGGGVLFIEVMAVPGKGRLSLTGKLGDVMKESAQAAVTYARAAADRWGVPAGFSDKTDLHIHIPAGAVPKDGPSAGVAMLTALISALSRRPVRRDVAATGEITLRGKVLPVGGIKEKVLAAHRAGVTEVVLPADNERDLEEVPEHVRRELTFHFAHRVDEVLQVALQAPVEKEDQAAA